MTRQPANNDNDDIKKEFDFRRLKALLENQPPERQEALFYHLSNFAEPFGEEPSGKAVYTPEEAALKLKVKLRTIREWLRQGKLKGVKIAHTWRIPKAELDKYLNPPTEAEEPIQAKKLSTQVQAKVKPQAKPKTASQEIDEAIAKLAFKTAEPETS
jgi:excisionase family DNA binding protein